MYNSNVTQPQVDTFNKPSQAFAYANHVVQQKMNAVTQTVKTEGNKAPAGGNNQSK